METKEFKNKLKEILESKKEKNEINNTIKIKDEDNEFIFQIFNFYEKEYNKNFWVCFDNKQNLFLNIQLIFKYINYFINFLIKTYKNIDYFELQFLDVVDQTYPYIINFSIEYKNNKILFINNHNKIYECDINDKINYNDIDLNDLININLNEYEYYEINLMFGYN